MATYRLRVVYQPETIPEAPELEAVMPSEVEEEIVEVHADSVENAAKRAMSYARIDARGRLVRLFDRDRAEVFTF